MKIGSEWRALRVAVARQIDGRIESGPALASDFGGTESGVPAFAVSPAHEQDIARVLRIARQWDVPVCVRGAGHSCNGQTLCPAGIVLINQSDAGDLILRRDGRVEVPTAMSWGALEARLNRAGRGNAVLTDYLRVTIGGTLSVGGYGVSSIRRGCQVDYVDRLRLITPSGDRMWCSPTKNPDLFRYALAGCGCVGVIARVILRTVRHRRFTRIYNFESSSLPALVESLQWVPFWKDRMPDTFWGAQFRVEGSRARSAISQYGFALDRETDRDAIGGTPLRATRAVHRNTLTDYPLYCQRTRERFLREFDDCARVWEDYVLDFEPALEFARSLESRIKAWRPTHLRTLYVLALRQIAGRPRLAFHAPGLGRDSYRLSIGLYFMPPRGEPRAVAQARRMLRWAQTRCIELGGHPYLYGWNRLDEAAKRRLYGDDYDRIRALRNTNGWSCFGSSGPLFGRP